MSAPNGSCWSPNLDQILADLTTVAKSAGRMIRAAHAPSSSASSSTLSTKKNSVDLVTATDRAVEAHISRALLAKYPTFAFLGEETYEPGMKLGAQPTFVVDPIDGTTNFVHGYGYVSVSLGFAVEREAVAGVVFNPFSGELYAGVKGGGSWVERVDVSDAEEGVVGREEVAGVVDGDVGVSGGGKKMRLPLRTSELTGLKDALVCVEWGSDRSGQNYETKMKTFQRLGRNKEEGGAMVHGFRCLGSAALNLSHVARGDIDCYWEGGCWAWDVCAGWVILSEAGGKIVGGNPGDWDVPVDGRKYLAVRSSPEGKGQKEFIEEFWSYVEGTMDYES